MTLSVRAKITSAIFASVFVGLVTVAVAFEVAFDNAVAVLREATMARSEARSRQLASAVVFPLAAKLRDDVGATLDGFCREFPNTETVAVFDSDGAPFLVRGNPVPGRVLETLLETRSSVAEGPRVWAVAPVELDGQKLGWIVLQQHERAAEVLRRRSRELVYGADLVTALVAIIMGGVIGRRIGKPLERMAKQAHGLAGGDLSLERLDSKVHDEAGLLAQAVDQMAESLRDQVGAIKNASGQVHSESGRALESAKALAAAAHQQAAAVRDANAAVANIQMSGENALESAQGIVAAAQQAVDVAQEGIRAVEQSLTDMRRVQGRVEVVAQRAEASVAEVEKANAIIEAVDEIAESSKMLAVNASLEAARAGEFGKGFAVVAREVSALAGGSLEATQRVRKTLSVVRKTIEELAEKAMESRALASTSTQTAEDSGAIIRRLGDVIAGTADAAKKIECDTRDQVHGLDKMTSAFEQIDQAAFGNLSTAEAVEAGCARLDKTAEELERLVAHYRLRR